MLYPFFIHRNKPTTDSASPKSLLDVAGFACSQLHLAQRDCFFKSLVRMRCTLDFGISVSSSIAAQLKCLSPSTKFFTTAALASVQELLGLPEPSVLEAEHRSPARKVSRFASKHYQHLSDIYFDIAACLKLILTHDEFSFRSSTKKRRFFWDTLYKRVC